MKHTPRTAGRVRSAKQENTRIIDRCIVAILTATIVGLPLFCIPYGTTQGIDFAKQIFFVGASIVVLMLWVLRTTLMRSLIIAQTPVNYALVAVLAIYAVAAFFSVDTARSMWGEFGAQSTALVSVLAAAVLFMAMMTFVSGRYVQRLIAIFAAVNAGAVAWTTLILLFAQTSFVATYLVFLPITLTGGSYGFFAFFALATLLLCSSQLGASAYSSAWARALHRIMMLLGMLTSVLVIMMLGNYMVWSLAAITVGILLVLTVSERMPASPLTRMLFTLTFLLMVFGAFAPSLQIASINLPAQLVLVPELSAKIAWEAVQDRPLLGFGPALYDAGFMMHRPQELNNMISPGAQFNAGQGLLAELPVTVGLLGFLAVAALGIVYSASVMRALKETGAIEQDRIVGIVSFVVVLGMCAVFFEHSSMALYVLAIAAALLLHIVMQSCSKDILTTTIKLHSSGSQGLAVACVSIAILGGLMYGASTLWRVIAADHHLMEARTLFAEGEADQSIIALNKAMQLRAGVPVYDMIAAEHLVAYSQLLHAQQGEGADAAQATRAQLMTSAQRFAESAVQQSPQRSAGYVARGMVYETGGDLFDNALVAAETAYQEALTRDPQNAFYNIRTGMLVLARAMQAEAEEERKIILTEAGTYFEKAREQAPGLAEPYRYLGMIAEAQGDLDTAIQNTVIALRLTRGDMGQQFTLSRMLQTRGNDEDFAVAEALLAEMLRQMPYNINVRLELAAVYKNAGRQDLARDVYNSTIEVVRGARNVTEEARQQIIEQLIVLRDGVRQVPTADALESTEENDTQEEEITTEEQFGGTVPVGVTDDAVDTVEDVSEETSPTTEG